MKFSDLKIRLCYLTDFCLEKLSKDWVFITFAFLLSLLFAGFLVHYFWNIPQESDVGCFMAIAHDLKAGKLLYSEVWDNKAPGIFFIHLFFQWVTLGNMHYPAIMHASFFFLLLLSLSLVVTRMVEHPIRYLLLPFGFFILYLTISQWAYFFLSGFTEEIGIYLMISGFLPLLLVLSNQKGGGVHSWVLVLSGVFIGASFLIKEPFVISLAAIIVVFILSKNQLKRKLLISFSLGLILLPFFFLIYLLWNSIFTDYLNYMQFALFYSKSEITKDYSTLLFNGIGSLFQNLKTEEPILRIILIIGALLIIIELAAIRNTSHIQYRNFLVGLIALLICQTSFFLISGDVIYNHYFIPLFLCLAVISFFGVVIYVSILEGRIHWFWGMLIALVSLKMSYTMWIESIQPFRGESLSVDQEVQELKGRKLEGSHCFVDDQSAGRFYFYLNAHSNLPFPSPYYVYFLFGKNEKGNELILKNNLRFQHEFKKNPPEFILSKEKLSVAFNYNQFRDYVNSTYTVIDSVKINSTNYVIRKRN